MFVFVEFSSQHMQHASMLLFPRATVLKGKKKKKKQIASFQFDLESKLSDSFKLCISRVGFLVVQLISSLFQPLHL